MDINSLLNSDASNPTSANKACTSPCPSTIKRKSDIRDEKEDAVTLQRQGDSMERVDVAKRLNIPSLPKPDSSTSTLHWDTTADPQAREDPHEHPPDDAILAHTRPSAAIHADTPMIMCDKVPKAPTSATTALEAPSHRPATPEYMHPFGYNRQKTPYHAYILQNKHSYPSHSASHLRHQAPPTQSKKKTSHTEIMEKKDPDDQTRNVSMEPQTTIGHQEKLMQVKSIHMMVVQALSQNVNGTPSSKASHSRHSQLP